MSNSENRGSEPQFGAARLITSAAMIDGAHHCMLRCGVHDNLLPRGEMSDERDHPVRVRPLAYETSACRLFVLLAAKPGTARNRELCGTARWLTSSNWRHTAPEAAVSLARHLSTRDRGGFGARELPPS